MAYLLFVWKPSGYELREREGDPPAVGDEVQEDEIAHDRDEGGAVAPAGRRAALRVHPTCLNRAGAAPTGCQTAAA